MSKETSGRERSIKTSHSLPDASQVDLGDGNELVRINKHGQGGGSRESLVLCWVSGGKIYVVLCC